MTDYTERVKALRCCAENFGCPIECPRYSPADEGVRACVSRLEKDAAAIEALQKEVQFYKALAEEWKSSAENKERLLRLYRAEQAKHFYSAMDNNGRIIANPCACMNIPVFPDSSESPNS